MSVLTLTRDEHPALLIKPMILCRSGTYWYTREEIRRRGITPREEKAMYSEYRPWEVIQRNKDKFGGVGISVEHTEEELSSRNWRDLSSGTVGDRIEEVDLAGGEKGLRANGYFYTEDVVDYMNAGNKDTSADYKSVVGFCDDGVHDFILKDIRSVNGVVVTERGRGGPTVRVMDSVRRALKYSGGRTMNFWNKLGLGRSKDAGKVEMSKVVMEGLKKFSSETDDAKKKAILKAVLEPVAALGESKTRDSLIEAVSGAFETPLMVIEHSKEASELIDGLYNKCRTEDTAAADAMKKELGGKEKKDGDEGDEAPDAGTKDTAKLITEVLAEVKDSLPALIKAGVAEALGLDPSKLPGKPKTEPKPAGSTKDGGIDIAALVKKELGLAPAEDGGGADDRSLDAGADLSEADFLLDHAFGSR